MKYGIIQRSVSVDDVTLTTNGQGQIEVKQELLNNLNLNSLRVDNETMTVTAEGKITIKKTEILPLKIQAEYVNNTNFLFGRAGSSPSTHSNIWMTAQTLEVEKSGTYRYGYEYATNNTGRISTRVLKNGVEVAGLGVVSATNTSFIKLTNNIVCIDGDIIVFQFQNPLNNGIHCYLQYVGVYGTTSTPVYFSGLIKNV